MAGFVTRPGNFAFQLGYNVCFHVRFLAWFTSIFRVLKMETTCSSETSLAFQRTTRRHVPEDIHLHNHRCENQTLEKFKITIYI
jgi:hypothetical protein